MPTPDSQFRNHRDLCRLPYFDLRDGHLVLSDPSFGPSVDAHTHLALSFLRTVTVDLRKEHRDTEHYVPMDRALDLDVYMNRNFTPWDLQQMKADLTHNALRNAGMRRTHTLPNLLREMHDLGISHSVLLPVELPFISRNAETYLELTAATPEILCFGSVHPYGWKPLARLDQQKRQGARGVKIHPAIQMIYPDDRRAMKVYRHCGELGLPVLWHCGPVDIEPEAGRRRSQVRLYEKPIAENPDTTFVLGHAGALQPEVALAFANRYSNVWLEVASQSLPVIRTLLDKAPADRLMMGSDWPFYHQATAVAKVLVATEGAEAARRRIQYDNAARLFGLPPRAIRP